MRSEISVIAETNLSSVAALSAPKKGDQTMADDAISAEQWNELLEEIRKLGQRIDDQDRKFIIVHGRSNTYCRVCSPTHSKAQHPGDPEISEIERKYHDAGHRFF
jgi:hypothetical protein